MLEVKKGDTVRIIREARYYVNSGFRSSEKIIPAEDNIAVVKKITKRKTGRVMWIQEFYEDGEFKTGYGISIDQMPEDMTVTVVKEA